MSLSRGEAIARSAEGGLDEARAVDPLRRPAAPKIRRLEKALGDRDEVRFVILCAGKMARPKMAPVLGDLEIAVPPHDCYSRAKRERHAWRQLDARSRISMRAHSGDPVRRLGSLAERRRRQIADILVAVELRPGPRAAFLVDRDAFAVERLGLLRRIDSRRTPERRDGRDDLPPLTLDISGRLEDSTQMSRGQIRRGRGSGGGRTQRKTWGSSAGMASTVAGPVWRKVNGRLRRAASHVLTEVAFKVYHFCWREVARHGRIAADPKDNLRGSFDPYGAVTDEVINQPVEFADYNLYGGDAALREAVRREGAAWAADGLNAFGQAPARLSFSNSARSRTATRLNSTPTTATGVASTWCAFIPPITR